MALVALGLAPIGSAADDGAYKVIAPPTKGNVVSTGQPGAVNQGQAGGTVVRPGAGGKVGKPGTSFTGKRCTRAGKKRTCFHYKSGKLTKRCVVNGKRTVCTYYNKAGRPYKACTWKRPGAKPKCHKIKGAMLTALGARDLVAFSDITATLPGNRQHVPWSPNGIIQQGFLQTMTAVGQIWLGNEHQCTGTLVATGIVLTAAHCIYSGGYYSPSQLTFAPGQYALADFGRIPYQPYGSWRVLDTFATAEYRSSGDFGRDWAFMLLGRDANGKFPGDYVGSWNMYHDINPIGHGYLVGYATEGIFRGFDYNNGNAQYHVNATWDSDISWSGSNWMIWWRSTMTGGSSGGPVFYEVSPGNWGIGGVINTLITHQCPDNSCRKTSTTHWSDWESSAYFDRGIISFWQQMLQAWG